ncbi:MAG: hypothetical protein M3R41_01405 [Pseudomonadota bacterium]|nr:hypothetical protein [Pseudomonadota bacterium]
MPTPAAAHDDAEPRARLVVALHVKRAGTNLTGVAVEYDIAVRNEGMAGARDVALDARLLSAGAQQDETIAMLFDTPVDRPHIAPFALAPGDSITLPGMGMLPRDMVQTMQANGRDLFVPVMTINLHYNWADGTGHTARAFMIGVERGAGAKMAPFAFDATRMHDRVAALEYTMRVDV